MKKIESYRSADLDWVEDYAQKLGGKIEGDFIIVPEDLFTGSMYFTDSGDDLVVLYTEGVFNQDFQLVTKNKKNDFIALYYNLSEGETSGFFSSNTNTSYNIGLWKYNLLVFDSSLETNYCIKAGSHVYLCSIFLSKNKLSQYAKKNPSFLKKMDSILDVTKNTVIKLDRMSDKSYYALKDLQKSRIGGAVFNLNLIGTAHLLCSDYINRMIQGENSIEKVNQSDLTSIIATQKILVDSLEKSFPSIHLLAQKANMSETKFQKLFKKITGNTPSAFFMTNKLLRAKELLEEKKLSVAQVSDALNMVSYSYFSQKFKEHFGISPKTFSTKL
jgi:AraC-like DNA-binding protein